jgi:thioredoxin 1
MDLRKMFEKKESPAKPQHVDDATFADEVIGSSEPILVDFWAPWCAPCRLVGGLLEEIAPQYAGRMRIVKLNVDENPQTAARFGIQSIPTMIIFKNGKAVDQIVGAMPLQPLQARIERHLAPVGTAAAKSQS